MEKKNSFLLAILSGFYRGECYTPECVYAYLLFCCTFAVILMTIPAKKQREIKVTRLLANESQNKTTFVQKSKAEQRVSFAIEKETLGIYFVFPGDNFIYTSI